MLFPVNASKYALTIERKRMLYDFEHKAGLKFKDINLLDCAFWHRSSTNENHNKHPNNERLEFLGDAVLGMATASHLYQSMADKPEGDLAKIKAVVVSEPVLSEIALGLGIDKCLILGKGEEQSGGRSKKAILADAMEAVIGAYYLDSGYTQASAFVLKYIVPEIAKVLDNKHIRDFKTLLQEFYQKQYKTCPVYELVKKTGPEHDRTFWVNVILSDVVYGPAKGKNKKEAEQAAAKLAWQAIQNQTAGTK
ncbi:MAG: ribonuclease III [Treponemataceae bacterium]|nr:ribonuclease III [Treponemataceae bacterium]